MRFRLPLSLPTPLAIVALLCVSWLPAAADSHQSVMNPPEALVAFSAQSLPVSLPECRYPRLVTEIPTSPSVLLTTSIREPRREVRLSMLSAKGETQSLNISSTQAAFKDLFATLAETFERMGYPAEASLVTIESPIANAFVRKNREVVVTTALMTRVREPSEIAFILAHELAHVALHHDSKGGIAAEVSADTLALRVITTLAFDPCSGPSVLERLGKPSELTLASLQPRLNALHNKTFEVCG